MLSASLHELNNTAVTRARQGNSIIIILIISVVRMIMVMMRMKIHPRLCGFSSQIICHFFLISFFFLHLQKGRLILRPKPTWQRLQNMKNLITADEYQWQTIKEAQSSTYTRMYMILICQRKTFFTCQTYNVHPSIFICK